MRLLRVSTVRTYVLDLAAFQFAPIEDLAFSAAGDLAIATKEHVSIAATSGRIARLAIGKADDEVTCVAFDSGRRLAIGVKESGLRIVALGGKPTVTQIATTCYWHMMLWSPDGKYIVGGQYEPWVSIVDVDARTEVRVLDPVEFDDSGRTALVFADDMLITTAYNKICRWRFADVIANKAKCRKPKTGVQGHAHLIDLVALDDGTLLALGDVEAAEYFLQRFAPTGERIGKKLPLETATFRLASLGDSYVAHGQIYSRDDEPLRALDGAGDLDYITAIAVSRDRTQIAMGSEHGVGIWDAATGRCLTRR